jgi:DNA helicase-2/ATP-dependent DNA helicase PcrA
LHAASLPAAQRRKKLAHVTWLLAWSPRLRDALRAFNAHCIAIWIYVQYRYSFLMMKAKPTAFDSLNPAQRRAATFGTVVPDKGVSAGPMLILAGAGTGKTNTLAHRTAHLVLNGVDPARILMLTFTRRAAQEMIRRTQKIVADVLSDRGKAGDRSVTSRLLWSGTFHSVGNRILRLYAKHLGLDPNYTVLDRADAADLMDVVRHDLGFSAKDKRFPRKDACLAIYSYRLNTRLSLKQTLEEQFPWVSEWEADLTRLYREYVGRKQKNRVLDFDDLLLYWHVMMQNPTLAQSLSKNFEHVLVDEYQDTSSLQGEIIQALKPDGKGVTVVGDDAQAIYSFRAAAVENILGFADRFKPKAEIVVLAQNYRSTQQVLDSANALMSEGARQHRKTLLGTRQSTQKTLYVSMDDAQAQAEYIAGKILVTREIGGSLKRHAILFRSSHHSDVLEVELTKRNIPFMKYGGLKFLEAAHVKDMMSVLRWADNPRNLIAAFRVLKLLPGIGPGHAKQAIDHFEAQSFSMKSLADFDAPQPVKMEWKRFCALLEKLADPATPWPGQVGLVRDWYKPQLERIYDAAWTRMGDLEQLEHLSSQHANRERFLTELTLDPPVATGDQSAGASKDEDYVILSTIHSAKGQEWDNVYVLNVSDGNFPSEFSTGKPEMIEEERRLLYVAMTRARNELHLCAPLKYQVTQQPKDGDAHVYGAKSRFMTDKVLDTCEKISLRNMRAEENLREVESAAVDVVAQLKEMW